MADHLPRKPVEIPERMRKLAELLAPAVKELIRKEFSNAPRRVRLLSHTRPLQ